MDEPLATPYLESIKFEIPSNLLSIKTYRSYYNRKYLTELKGPEIEISAAMGDFSNPITSAHAFRAIFAPLCILML